jgi:hypothetical protein
LDLQKYLNKQEDNFKTINLVSDCLEYTLLLQKYIDSSNVKIMIQAFNTLTEVIQGPCEENQILLRYIFYI